MPELEDRAGRAGWPQRVSIAEQRLGWGGAVFRPLSGRGGDFRVHVDKVHEWLQSAEGRVASQVFTPHTVGDDGVTMSLWRSDSAMIDTMYRPGVHRTQVDRHRRESLADRTSFTRFRVLETRGLWNGSDPFALARGSV